jgi:3-(3-hydroxy-phenyl)propionate hydroxylase/6-hydroxy-3-succinoylpyridine 3-monooxygenase
MVYQWCVLPLFAELGMLAGMTRLGVVCTEYSMLVLATGENLRLDLSTLADVAEHPFNLHVPQTAVAEVGVGQLSQLPDARIEWGVNVGDVQQDRSGVTVKAQQAGEDLEYRADWVIGADGSHSVVRRSLGLSFAGTTWPKHLLSSDLRFDLATLGHAVASTQLDPTHGALIGKVDATGLWRYTCAENRTLPAEQTTARALEAITAALGVEDPQVQTVVPYRVHQRSADAFRVGRAILVGDAAHLTNPSLAFGMLSGLYDAKLLIDALPAVDTLGDDVLDRYSSDRHENFWGVTSPRSSANMELVFSPGTAAQLDERVEYYREIASSRDETRRFFLDYLDCESTSRLGV